MICLEVREEVKKPVVHNDQLYLHCEVCFEKIGIVDEEKLVTPLMGFMFKTFDPAHGRPAPFRPEADWLALLCPYCRRRAMYEPDQITTQHGKLKVYSQKKKEQIDAKEQEKKLKEAEVVEYISVASSKEFQEGEEVFFHEIPAKYLGRDGHQVKIQYEDGSIQHVNWKMLKKKRVYYKDQEG